MMHPGCMLWTLVTLVPFETPLEGKPSAAEAASSGGLDVRWICDDASESGCIPLVGCSDRMSSCEDAWLHLIFPAPAQAARRCHHRKQKVESTLHKLDESSVRVPKAIGRLMNEIPENP